MTFAQPRVERSAPAPRMNQAQMIAALRKEATINPVFNAVCLTFTVRERARQQITIDALVVRMFQEGYRYSKQEYQNCLRFMASLGIGTLELGPKNQIRALKNIRLTLQSIGEAAVTNVNNLDKFTPAFRYQKAMIVDQPAPDTTPKAVEAAPLKKPAPTPTAAELAVSLTAVIEGQPVTFPLPKISTHEFGELLAKLFATRGDK